MSIIAMYKTCETCNKTFLWNPDVGRMNCPRCGKPVIIGRADWKKILASGIRGQKKKVR